MKKRLICLIVFSVSTLLAAQEQQVTVAEATLAAFTRVKAQVAATEVDVTDISWMENENKEVLLYEIETNQGLTILLSGNKACQPILAVHSSEEGLYLTKYEELPCGIRFFIDWYKEQVNSCFANKGMTLYYKDEWDNLIAGQISSPTKNGRLSPLLNSNWRQRLPNSGGNIDAYNYLISGNTQCDHCLAGCVAVAMGQVMYYWKYPVLDINRETQFDWCKMSDNLDIYSSSYYENRDAISGLLSECGQSVNMSYGCNGSNAYTADVRDALVNDYNYSSAVVYKDRFWYSDNDWILMLQKDLNKRWPVIYHGRSALIGGGGHSFVCDGYNEYNEFHFNWGWHQLYNSPSNFYTLNHLSFGGDTNFNYWQGAVFCITPEENQNWCDITLDLGSFYNNSTLVYLQYSSDPYSVTPQTMTKLISASASSPEVWRKIPYGATATYQAHEEILLRDGFAVEEGADFTAQIIPCPNCETRDVEATVDEESERSDMTVESDDAETILNAIAPTTDRTMELTPNPTSGEVAISMADEVQAIVIYNAQGRPVGRWKILSIAGNNSTIDVSTLPAGPYLVRITTPSGTVTKKLLVQRR